MGRGVTTLDNLCHMCYNTSLTKIKENKMEMERTQENEGEGTTNPAVVKLIAEAREKIYEAIAIETGDPVEEVKKFFAEVEKANKEKNVDRKPMGRQHTLFTNIVGDENLIGICIIVGYQKKDADAEKVQPMKFLTSRLLEPLGSELLAASAMNIEAKKSIETAKANSNEATVELVESTDEHPIATAEAVTGLGQQEGKKDSEVPSEVVETKHDENIPF